MVQWRSKALDYAQARKRVLSSVRWHRGSGSYSCRQRLPSRLRARIAATGNLAVISPEAATELRKALALQRTASAADNVAFQPGALANRLERQEAEILVFVPCRAKGSQHLAFVGCD